MLGRSVAVVSVLVVLVACGAAWMATCPPLEQFVVPGATDIQVIALAMEPVAAELPRPAPENDISIGQHNGLFSALRS